ncbi:MAG: hypothetical protein ACFE96_14665 [Candidatus Hermodarchaeota archaeon]
MTEPEKSYSIHKYFETLVETIIKITEIYRFEGKLDDAINIFKFNVPIIDFKDVRSVDKAKFLIQYAKILQQSKFIKEFNYDKEIEMLTEARELAKSSNAKNLMADALDLIGTCIYSKGILEGEYEEAIEYFNLALRFREEIDDVLGLCKSYFNIGLYHENKKDLNEEDRRKSFDYYQKGLEIAIDKNFKLEQAYFYRHLAYFYQYFENDEEKSLQYHLNSAKLREEIGFKISLQFSYFAVAMAYFFLSDFENSLQYFKKAYSWATKMKRLEQLKVLIFRRGNQLIKNNRNNEAIKYYELVLESATKEGDLESAKEIEAEINSLSSKI